MITSFPDKPASNLGGAASFLFAPYNQVNTLPLASGKLITSAVTFIAGAYFLTGYATLETLKFSETPTADGNGTYYTWSIQGFVPGDSPGLVDLMEEMELVRHLVAVKDMAGVTRLVGYNAPLDFSSSFTPGDDMNAARGYNFVFSGSGRKRAPVYRVT